MNGSRGQQRPVSHPELRTLDLPAQDRKLVPQDEQLDVFHVQAAAATYERAQQGPKGEEEEGEGHAADPPSRLAPTWRRRYWRRSGVWRKRNPRNPRHVPDLLMGNPLTFNSPISYEYAKRRFSVNEGFYSVLS